LCLPFRAGISSPAAGVIAVLNQLGGSAARTSRTGCAIQALILEAQQMLGRIQAADAKNAALRDADT